MAQKYSPTPWLLGGGYKHLGHGAEIFADPLAAGRRTKTSRSWPKNIRRPIGCWAADTNVSVMAQEYSPTHWLLGGGCTRLGHGAGIFADPLVAGRRIQIPRSWPRNIPRPIGCWAADINGWVMAQKSSPTHWLLGGGYKRLGHGAGIFTDPLVAGRQT